MPTFEPVEYDPFAAPKGGGPTLTPVEHDPFAIEGSPRGATSEQLVSPVADIFQSIPRAAVKGVWNWLNSVTGEGQPSSSEAMERPGAPGATTPATTGEEFASTLTPNLPKPQGKAGRYADTTIEFLANPAWALGPGGFAAKLGTTVASALGSEAAGQATAGTAAEPYARLAGGLAGGLTPQAAVRGAEKAIVRERKPPTMGEHETESDLNYKIAKALDVQLHPTPGARLATDIATKLEENSFRTVTTPVTFALIKELGKPLAQQRAATIADFDSVRRVLGRTERANLKTNSEESKAAALAIEMIDDHLSNLQPAQVVKNAHNLPIMLQELEKGRGNYRVFKRSEALGEATERGENQAAVSGTGANIENALRQQFNKILNSPQEKARYSREEIALIKKVVKGSPVGNVARGVGKMAPHGPVSVMTNLAAAAVLGPHGLFLPVVGEGGKLLGEHMTRGNIRMLDEILRKSSPLALEQAAARGPAGPGWNASLGMTPPAWTALRAATPAAASLSPQGP
jgi:hypothetical protein